MTSSRCWVVVATTISFTSGQAETRRSIQAKSGFPSTGISTLSGQVVLNFSGTNGQSYKVLTSTNVAQPLSNWVSIATGTLTGSTLYYTNGPATNAQQFYIITSP